MVKRLHISLLSTHVSNKFTVYFFSIIEGISKSDVRKIMIVHIPGNTKNDFFLIQGTHRKDGMLHLLVACGILFGKSFRAQWAWGNNFPRITASWNSTHLCNKKTDQSSVP